jgi:hypothetical protein
MAEATEPLDVPISAPTDGVSGVVLVGRLVPRNS